ncbi:MAG: hypothetical protein GY870_22430 [archaeon]|nr:hypothetical protein [archaeon]
MEFDTDIKPKCSMLIDQNLEISNGMGGSDPLGHTCYNDAVYTDGVYFYCKECKNAIFKGKDNHITKPDFNCVQLWRQFVRL